MAEPSKASAARLVRFSVGTRALLAGAVTALFLAGALPPALGIGANIEEVAGLLTVTPTREYADSTAPSAVPAGGPALVESPWMPVYSLRLPDGTDLPLLVDGHIGALPYYPYRPLAATGSIVVARLLSVATGIVALLALVALGARLRDERVGWLAALLLATSPLFVFLQAWVHPDEHWSYLGILLALLATLRFHRTRLTRWIVAAALLAGLAVAAKNTAAWVVLALAAAAFALDVVPRLRLRQWAASAAAFTLPLLPQLAYLTLAPSRSALSRRVGLIASPDDLFDLTRLRFFAGHFGEAFAGLGAYLGPQVDARTIPALSPLPGVGALFALLTAAVCVTSLRRHAPVPMRLFGLSLGLVLIQYVAFYYVGMSLFGLVTPWVPLAAALALVVAWDRASGLRRAYARRAARALTLTLLATLVVNNLGQVARYAVASTRPAYTVFDRSAQAALAHDLDEAGVAHPVTTTYGIVGVLELLTRNRVRPVHLFELFKDLGHDGYERPWEIALDRLGPGTHTLILTPDPSPIDVSPCKDADRIASTLEPVVRSRGGSVRTVRKYELSSGATGFLWVDVTLPER